MPKFLMVLADGETYTELKSCTILAVEDSLTTDGGYFDGDADDPDGGFVDIDTVVKEVCQYGPQHTDKVEVITRFE